MNLRADIAEMLSDFEKRMKVIHIARFLFDYTYKDSIRAMVPDRDILDNIIIAVLVYVKERTLGNDQSCTLRDVADFLSAFSAVLPENIEIESEELARFIMVDVLQKGGFLKEYQTYFSDKQEFKAMPIRLVEEEKGAYHLSDDAFDFLFRTKEIESELDYSVTRFRLSEYMKRNNYKEALEQSKELVTRIRGMKISMDDFVRRCRENINKITIDQYEGVIFRIRNLLDSEYREMQDIQKNAEDQAKRLAEAYESGVGAENIQNHYRTLKEIIQNIQTAIDEQRSLSNKKVSLSETYKRILEDSYAVNRYERLNFENEIMARLRAGDISLDSVFEKLLFPLATPSFAHMLSIESLYSPRIELREEGEPDSEDLTLDDQGNVDSVEVRNQRFLDICTDLFAFIGHKTTFKVSEFVASLDDESLCEYCIEHAFQQVVMALYAMQTVSVDDWRSSDGAVMTPLGEFELAWCMSEMPEQLLEKLRWFTISKLDREFSFTVQRNGRQKKIEMTDFLVEVER